MLLSIDRFEGEFAVLVDEDGNAHNVLRTHLPAQAKAGTMLREIHGEYTLDDAAERMRREKILQLQNKLRHKELR